MENAPLQEIGIIGTGAVGGALARLAARAGLPAVLANSRPPREWADDVADLGPTVRAGTLQEAAEGDVVVLAVPLTAVPELPEGLLAGRVVLHTGNYYPFRDGRIADLDEERMTAAQWAQAHLPGARLVQGLSSMVAPHLPRLARPGGADEASGELTFVPVAGDDAAAVALARAVIGRLGYGTVAAGGLEETWRFEPEAEAYTQLYAAPGTPMEGLMESTPRPVGEAELRDALARAARVRVGERRF